MLTFDKDCQLIIAAPYAISDGEVFTYVPASKVGWAHQDGAAELLQNRVWKNSTAIGQEESLTLHLSQRQHHCWVLWRHIQHLRTEEEPSRVKTLLIDIVSV